MKFKSAAIFIGAVITFMNASTAASEQWYHWSDVSGTHVTIAKFLSLDGNTLRLQKQDSTEVAVPLNRLSRNTRMLAQSLRDTQSMQVVEVFENTTPEQARIRLEALVSPGKTEQWPSWKNIYFKLGRAKEVIQPLTEVFDDSWKKDTYFPIVYYICSVLNLIGLVWIVVAAFRIGLGWGFLILFPCTAILAVIPFLIRHWDVAKGPFFLSIFSTLLWLGGILLVPSWAPEAGRMEGVIMGHELMETFNLNN